MEKVVKYEIHLTDTHNNCELVVIDRWNDRINGRMFTFAKANTSNELEMPITYSNYDRAVIDAQIISNNHPGYTVQIVQNVITTTKSTVMLLPRLDTSGSNVTSRGFSKIG